jgi:D-alanyl-lipoteichoic acid acyltransferase DltB (MBOAT superfamily)
MLFHTWVFLVFCLIVFPVYLLVRKHNRLMNIWFLIASYTFYGWWNPWYLLLLFGTSAIDYWMVLLMERKQSTRKLWLIISLVSNFGFLGYFKYSGFITENINWIFGANLPDPAAYPNYMLAFFGAPDDWLFSKVVLPIGISFHTFQSMSYTIDAYFGSIQTERSFIRFLTFVSFFPQLVAGPIERAGNLLPQLQGTPTITRDCIADGLSLFLVGFFKKVALADYLARYVDQVYGLQSLPATSTGPELIVATVAFGWQIYFDFSGYTDMARGIAELMGFRLMLNFNNPYTATGLGDFWGRWHISLSTWFKDYVYFPLGGNRGTLWATYRNMFLTMVISGVWHGADWGFIIWGALHAIARCLTRDLELTYFWKERVPRFAKQMAVFAFVTFTWIFFRAPGLLPAGGGTDKDGNVMGARSFLDRLEAWQIIKRICWTGWDGSLDPKFPLLLAALVLAVWVYQFIYASQSPLRQVLEWNVVKVGLAVGMIAYVLIVAQSSTKQVIYFQF